MDQVWEEYDPATGDRTGVLDEYTYGYDPAGNRLWKENVVAGDAGKDFDELYTYDDLYRLDQAQRGDLDLTDPDNPQITDQVFAQDWGLDGLGNFATFNDNGSEQNRTVNEANEITGITGEAGWIEPEYDNAGNMVSGPKPGAETTRLFASYDAWNRLRKVYEDDGDGEFEPSDAQGGGDDALLATYEFDGTGRRIEKHVTEAAGGPRDVDYLYNHDWQLLQSETPAGGPTAVDQYVWSVTYVDAPVVRFHDANGNGDYEDEGDTVHYYTRDANQNVTAMIDPSGTVVERYVYDPYGKTTVYDDEWSANPQSPIPNPFRYCGYFFDAETGLYNVRWRIYHSTLSTWLTRDPIGYSAGDSNLYRYVRNSPTMAVDPSGLEFIHVWEMQPISPVLAAEREAFEKIVPTESTITTSELLAWIRAYPGEKVVAGAYMAIDPFARDSVVFANFQDFQTKIAAYLKQGHSSGLGVLEIRGHGNPKMMHFGRINPDEKPEYGFPQWLKPKPSSQAIQTGPQTNVITQANATTIGWSLGTLRWHSCVRGLIVLSSCCVGNEKGDNIPQLLADASGRYVVAAGGFMPYGSVIQHGTKPLEKYSGGGGLASGPLSEMPGVDMSVTAESEADRWYVFRPRGRRP